MALIKCHECGKEVSTSAAACPSCGAPPKAPEKPKKKTSVAGVAFLSLIMVIGIAKYASDSGPKEAPKAAAAECAKDDLQCLGDKAVVAAGVYCKDPVERLAKHSVRWTDGTFETKFSRFRWAEKAAGRLTMVGDKAEFQNGFGAYTPVIYECDMDADGKTVLGVRVREGRLPQ